MKRRARILLTAVAVFATAAGTGAVAIAGPAGAAAHHRHTRGHKPPITIGMSISKTGSAEVDGLASLRGEEYAIASINKSGGWLGRKLKLVVIDDQSEPTASSQAYSKLITQDHVDLILGPYGSDLSNAAAAVAARYKYVMLDPAMPSPMKQGKYAIADEPTLETYMAEFPQVAAKYGYKKLAVVYQNSEFGIGCMQGEVAAAKKVGVKVVYKADYPYPTNDLSSIAQAIKASGANAVGACTFYTDGVTLTRALDDISYKPGLLGESIGPSESVFATTLGSLAEGVISSTSWWPSLPTKGNKAYVKGFEKKFGQPSDYHAANYYAGMQVLGDAVKAAHSLDQNKIMKALYGKTYQTILGTFKINNKDETMAGYVQYLYQDKKGTSQDLIWPTKYAEGPVIHPYGG